MNQIRLLMLVPGTEMHLTTFCFICLELVIFFWLIIYRLAIPDDRSAGLDMVLIVFLIIYNVTGGLLPDSKLPGSYFLQNCIAYGTGFITPCYFPYYVFKGFGLIKMHFHAFRGVYFFLVVPYILFVLVFYVTNNLDSAQTVLIIPTLYGIWVLFAVWKAIQLKYGGNKTAPSTEESVVLFISLSPWVCLPLITYFDFTQSTEAAMTNSGFLLLLALHIKRKVERIRYEHQRLIDSEKRLTTWNEQLQAEVEKRTLQLERMSKEERISENCRLFRLTTREKEIAQLICQGLTYRQIGDELYIAEATVAKHAQNIFEKAAVSNKMELCTRLERLPNST